MRVLSVCEYRASAGQDPGHWTPYCVTAGVKGRPFEGATKVEIDGVPRTIDQLRNDAAMDWAAQRLGQQIGDEYSGYVAVVPIPGHASVSATDVRAHRLFALAQRVAIAINSGGYKRAEALPLLHWVCTHEPVHQTKGPRDPLKLLANYRIDDIVVKSLGTRKVVLVDDVVTTGAHLRAAEHCLRTANINVLDVGFAVARTVRNPGDGLRVAVATYPPL